MSGLVLLLAAIFDAPGLGRKLLIKMAFEDL